jgi:hypothetical protein
MEKSNTTKPVSGDNDQKKLVQESNDHKIDQDFAGFNAGHAQEKIINPKNEADRKTAAVNHKDGEKMNHEEIDEAKSDGSAGAFAATEQVQE